MFKNIQFKIILIFFLIGIIIISGLGIFFLNSLNEVSMQIQNEQITTIEQISNSINEIHINTRTTLTIATVVFAIVGVLIAIFLSKFVIYPINKLIKSAEKISDDDKKIKTKHKKANEVGELNNVFGINSKESN